MESRVSAVATLARLPLFQLSTAGMELFHTNMLYWLATERPDESVSVWRALGLTEAHIDQRSSFIRREWHHLDLVVAPGDGQPALVIENKIGAIPTPDQLNRYYATLKSARLPFSLESTTFVLLTLTPSSFALPEPWRSVIYRELMPTFRETAESLTGADAQLVAQYADMVAHLDQIAAAYDPAGNLDAPIALSHDERTLLNESRLLALVEKVRAGRFAELATNALSVDLGNASPVNAGFSKGFAINDWSIDGPAGRRFGWQIQGGQLRLVVVTSPSDPRSRLEGEALVAELYDSYFDFTLPYQLAHVLKGYSGKKQWLSFGPNFIYRYALLQPETTWRHLLDLVVWFSRHALTFAAAADRRTG